MPVNKEKSSSGYGIFSESFETRIFEALTLIIVGIIFLLNTTGVLPWSIWLNFFKLWPLFIVSAGISIIFSGSRWLKFTGSLLGFLLFLGMMSYAIFSPFAERLSFIPFFNNTQDLEYSTTLTSKNNSDVDLVNLEVRLPAGRIDVDSSDSSDLFNLSAEYSRESLKPRLSEELKNDELNLKIDTTPGVETFFGNNNAKYALSLSKQEAPYNLDLKVGAGELVFNLKDSKFGSFVAETGAGKVVLYLSEESLPTGNFVLKTGAGGIYIEVPKDAPLRINYKIGVGRATVDGEEVQAGSVSSFYESKTYISSSNKYELSVETGVGTFELVTK
ncbi:hypothetical protein H3C67_05170 [Candidatus Dojkabacteria bacterium]|uniref:DUF5668 domain-containing protein n=1 Tax=Candidatus Dojkabacteria bacterium TaxID=2099670 RepID=A0A952AIM7_9BACT|nr:hypothetical protein [Candidatus Dojkabacteria bacterium]